MQAPSLHGVCREGGVQPLNHRGPRGKFGREALFRYRSVVGGGSGQEYSLRNTPFITRSGGDEVVLGVPSEMRADWDDGHVSAFR